MKKIIATLTVALGVVLCMQPLYAEEQKVLKEQKRETTGLWESLRKKIETLTPKKKLIATTAVGGVRGALVESDDLYWKGERTKKEIDIRELGDFENALVLFESGNAEGAKNAFTRFVAEYPESRLITDANQALALLKSVK